MHPEQWIEFVGPNRALQIAGVKLLGINAENAQKLLFSLAFVFAVILLSKIARLGLQVALRGGRLEKVGFWASQAIHVLTTVVMLVCLLSIWFDDPARLATAVGLVTAGLAFALQKVITALAGYVVILRGTTFNVGDRISMGGVRGDVISLSFIQTTIMEMGMPPRDDDGAPETWVWSRQYTGRVVTVTNDKIFEDPVYNYTREFPYIWEEMHLPISYQADRKRAEAILLEVAERRTASLQMLSSDMVDEMTRRHLLASTDLKPQVYLRLTDNWVELTVRFIVDARRVREIKNLMSRDILERLEQAGIGIASSTFEIVGLPPLKFERARTKRMAEPPASTGNHRPA